MRILFKYPTRSRPDWFKETLSMYYKMMSDDCDFEFVITLDQDDVTMNNNSIRKFLNDQLNLSYLYGKSKTKIEACNADVDHVREWDVLVLVSDDMIPMIKDFDKIIVELMTKYFPDTDGVLHFNDGLFGKDKCVTLSIMGRKMYKRFGYVYHPSYRSFYCDNEFTDEVYALNRCHYDPRVIIKHKWHGGPKSKDALYRRNSGMKGDEAVYNRRKLLNFPKENGWRMQ